jgi:iron-sulfur cluster assembly protein
MLNVTPRALDAIKKTLSGCKKTPLGLRVGVIGSGCDGFSYRLEVAYSSSTRDVVIDLDGVLIYVDTKSLVLIEGSTLDYENKNLLKMGFIITNPREKSTCGCGKSFSV